MNGDVQTCFAQTPSRSSMEQARARSASRFALAVVSLGDFAAAAAVVEVVRKRVMTVVGFILGYVVVSGCFSSVRFALGWPGLV